MKKLNVALVGLGFGKCFLPIWLDHPNVASVTVCDRTEALLLKAKEEYPQIRITTSLEAVLKDETIDAVHLVTPIPLHADQSVAVLESGKHPGELKDMVTSPGGTTIKGMYALEKMNLIPTGMWWLAG